MTCAYAGKSTYTTAFAETIWYFAYTILTHRTFAQRSLVLKNFFWTKWQLCEFSQLRFCNFLTKWQLCELSQLGFCLCLASAYTGKSACTRVFYWSDLILCINNIDILSMCTKKCHAIKLFFLQNDCLSNLAILHGLCILDCSFFFIDHYFAGGIK